MSDETLAELTERFGTGDEPLQPDILSELKSIMRLYGLGVSDMFFKWESYCIKMDMDTKTSLDSLRAFKQDLQDALERSTRTQANVKTEKRVGATPRTGAKNSSSDVFGMLDNMTTPGPGRSTKLSSARKRHLETPSVSRIKTVPASSPLKIEDQLNSLGAIPPSSFNDRQNPGEVIEVLNEQLPAPEPPIAPFGESRIRLTAGSDQKKLGYRPLFMKHSETSEILDDRIEEFAKIVMDHHQIEESAFGSAARKDTSEVVAVGRIACDSAEGRLNAASLVLETSSSMGNAFRVPLNLKQLKGHQFFPGQIVALRGSNTTDREFTVNEVLEIPPLPNAASDTLTLKAHRDRLHGGPDAMDSDSDPAPLSILFASGPYTADDNLDFEPLHTLCTRAADTYADALVLAGPFIDSEHPMIASGDFDLPEDVLSHLGSSFDPDSATMATVFKCFISPALNRLVAANPHVTILLVPSVRDVIDSHSSWPQDAFPKRELGLPKAAKIIGNPMTLSINEAVLGISTQDVLFELRQEELVGGRPADPMLLSRLARYLIEQRHYFPLFPPTDRRRLPKMGTEEGVPPGAMLDVSYLKLGEMLNIRPDILVLPSSLPPFAKVVESVLVINPGYLSKRRGAGTYARMTLYPPDLSQGDAAAGGMLAHKVFERARVEITRI
ncbi:DNA polymerase alpha subunit B N-terminal-domain-containing protein [Lasiosphaeria hispida]|uniref:DNA polymerase alpha subunit B n=1 Tax=Lasiosphaeria hispida TaxID=260671 RepID=A0AAJ0MH72_9PEZI|nr:DNA polymerase alpha subunit B N-terminal-domain-containing protein [Lasiosphaeria hispida]